MTAAVDDIFRVLNADLFLKDFNGYSDGVSAGSTSANVYYMLLGDQVPYASPASDSVPPQAITYVKATYDLWRGAYGAKIIPGVNVVACIPRVNWVTGTVYNQYDAFDTNLINEQFVVVNSALQVYKCLSNNGNAASTVQPTGTTANAAFVTGDGYRWKYMYTVSPGDASNFLTTTFIPVRRIASNNIPAGSLESYRLILGGTGYTPNSSFSCTITGDGSGATANALSNGSGIITHVETGTSGSGYTWATLTIPPPGSGQTAVGVPNVSPPGGHGASNTVELFARYAMVTVQFQFNEGGNISTATTFRQVALVKNPIDSGTSVQAASTSYDMAFQFSFSGAVSGAFQSGEPITTSRGATGYVVEYDTGPSKLLVNFVQGPSGSSLATWFQSGDVITGSTSGAFGTISGVTLPGLVPFTGNLLYYEDRTPVARASNQIEDILIIFEY